MVFVALCMDGTKLDWLDVGVMCCILRWEVIVEGLTLLVYELRLCERDPLYWMLFFLYNTIANVF